MAQVAIALAISAGGMALQYLLTPKVKQQPVDKGKMDDVRIIGSEYGAFIPRTWGVTRLSGNIVVSTGVDHYTVTSGGNSGGGKKGGGGGTETTHIYKTSVGVLVHRSVTDEFLRIWADADLITNNTTAQFGSLEAEDATLTGGASVSTSGTGWSGTGYVTNLGSGGKASFNVSSITAPPRPRNGDPDETLMMNTRISFFYKSSADYNVTIDTNLTSPQTEAFPSTAGEWTAYTVEVTGFSSTITFENASGPAPDLDKIFVEKFWSVEAEPLRHQNRITGVVNPDIAYPTNLNDPSEYYNYDPADVKNGTTGTYALTTPVPGEEIRFYTGTETQTADAKIKSWLDARYGTGEGVLRASAMRGLTYVFFQDRTLKTNRVENFTFETDTGDATVNTILADLFEDVGLTSGYYNVSATAGLEQIGFVEHTKTSRKSLIESLERYHGFRIGEIDGKIKTILDDYDPSARLITEDQLRAHSAGEEMPRYDAEVIIQDEKDLPREVRVSVMQPDLEYHNESVPGRLFANISGENVVDYTFPIVDTADNARLSAEKLQLKAYAGNKAIEVWGMPSTAEYAIGDIIAVLINGTYHACQIEKKQMSLPIGPVRFQCITVNPFAPTYYQSEVTTLAPKAVNQFVESTFPRNSVAFIIPSVPIRDTDRGRQGVYIAACGRGRGNGDNIALYREMDADNYVLYEKNVTPSLLGLCEDTLATHGGGTGTEDTTNVLDIWFFDDISLETVLQADIDRHPLVNLIRVGDEWIQFRTATAQTLEDNSPYRSKWRVSNLWRGRFSTSAAISTHAAGEYAAVVTPSLHFFELDAADIGETVNIKAVTNGQAVDVAPISSFTYDGPISAYTITNSSADRVLDADNTTLNELADFVATMADDLNL